MGVTIRSFSTGRIAAEAGRGSTDSEVAQIISKWVLEKTVELAYSELRDAVDHEGFDNRPTVVVDNRPRAPIESVKPFGKVVFVSKPIMAEVVRWALTELQKRSPVLTGRYASSHVVMIDGQEVQGDIWGALANIKQTSRVQIVNFQPYARKIETNRSAKRGKKKRAALSSQAKGGVYQPVLRALVTRYSKSMFFDFKYVKLPALGVKVWGDQGGGRRKSKIGQALLGNHKRTRVRRDQVYPALQFFIKPTGLPS